MVRKSINRRELLKRGALLAGSTALAGVAVDALATCDMRALPRPTPELDPVAFGADPTGTANSTEPINRAIASSHASGGGVVRVPPGVYSITRRLDATNNRQGGVYLLPGVSLLGYGATLRMDGNAAHILTSGLTTQPGAVAIVTAKIHKGDSSVTVDTSSGFHVGDEVFCRLGENPIDMPEASYWLYAKISDLPDSHHITLDRPLVTTFNPRSVANPRNRSISKLDKAATDLTIAGFTLTQGLAGNVEDCIFLDHVRRATIRDITAIQPGSGITAYYSESIQIANYRVLQSMKQSGQASKGRGLTFSGVKDCLVEGVELNNCEGAQVFSENYSRGVRLKNVNVELADKASVDGIFTASQYSELAVSRCRVSGPGANALFSANPTLNSTITSQDLELSTSPQLVRGPILSEHTGYLRIHGEPEQLQGDWHTVRKEAQVVHVAPNLRPGRFSLPDGLHRQVTIYASSLVGVVSLFLGTNDGTGLDLLTQLIADQARQISPNNCSLTQFGSGLVPFSTTGRNLTVYTSSSVRPGTFLRVEIEYYVMQR